MIKINKVTEATVIVVIAKEATQILRVEVGVIQGRNTLGLTLALHRSVEVEGVIIAMTMSLKSMVLLQMILQTLQKKKIQSAKLDT